MTFLPVTLPIGWTAAEIRTLLAPLRDDAVLTGAAADDAGVTLGWSLTAPQARPTGPPKLTWPATLPGLPQIARELRQLPAGFGRPTIEKAGERLGLVLRRSEYIAIKTVFDETWPPDPSWWAHLPDPATPAESTGPAELLPDLRELPAAPAAHGR